MYIVCYKYILGLKRLVISREVTLKRMIIENFIPAGSLKIIESRIQWDEQEQVYKSVPMKTCLPLKCPSLSEMRDEISTCEQTSKDDSDMKVDLYASENILQLRPSEPKKFTRDYIPPRIDPYINSLVKKAFDDVEKDTVVDCSCSSKMRLAYSI